MKRSEFVEILNRLPDVEIFHGDMVAGVAAEFVPAAQAEDSGSYPDGYIFIGE